MTIKNQEQYDALVAHLQNDTVWNAFPQEIRTKHLTELQEDLCECHFNDVVDSLNKPVKKERKPRKKAEDSKSE